MTLNNLGIAWDDLGDARQAVSYLRARFSNLMSKSTRKRPIALRSLGL